MKLHESILKALFIIFFVFINTLVITTISWCGKLDPVTVDAQIDNLKPTLGDVITYSITVSHDPDIVVHMPEYVIPEGLEKVGNGKSKPLKNKQQNIQEFWLKLRIDKTGPISFPAIPVWFNAPDQNKNSIRGKILTPKVNIEVQSLLKLEGNVSDLKDIKPIAKIDALWSHYIWKALGLLCLLVLAYVLGKKFLNKSDIKTENNSILTAEQQAIKELKALENRDWIKLGRVRDHFFELSEIFRRYLENRYFFPAQEWTTEEIIYHFKNFSDLSGSQKMEAISILSESDKIKFAKAEVDSHYDLIDPVTRFIKDTAQIKVSSEEISSKY